MRLTMLEKAAYVAVYAAIGYWILHIIGAVL